MATSIQLRDLNQLSKMTESCTGSRYECNLIDELILMLYFFTQTPHLWPSQNFNDSDFEYGKRLILW